MIFSKFFHLSREGSKTIMQAGIWLAAFNLAALLPVVLLAMVSEDMMAKHFAGDGGNTNGKLACWVTEEGILYQEDNFLSVSTLCGNAMVFAPSIGEKCFVEKREQK